MGIHIYPLLPFVQHILEFISLIPFVLFYSFRTIFSFFFTSSLSYSFHPFWKCLIITKFEKCFYTISSSSLAGDWLIDTEHIIGKSLRQWDKHSPYLQVTGTGPLGIHSPENLVELLFPLYLLWRLLLKYSNLFSTPHHVISALVNHTNSHKCIKLNPLRELQHTHWDARNLSESLTAALLFWEVCLQLDC